MHYFHINTYSLIALIISLYIASVIVAQKVQVEFGLKDPQWALADAADPVIVAPDVLSAARAIGQTGTVFMGTADKECRQMVKKAGKKTWERMVKFPLWEEFGEQIDSDIADIKNLGGENAGAITAGKFLQHFTDYPWLHFDIAGPAYLKSANHYRPAGGTVHAG